jgi:hypothetical protein
MRLIYRRVLRDSIFDFGNGDITPELNVTLFQDECDCDPPSTITHSAKYNQNTNYGKLKTDFLYFAVQLTTTTLDIGSYNNEDFIPYTETIDEPYDIFVRKRGVPLENYLTTDNYLVTGQTESRINEIDFYGNPQVNLDYDDVEGSFTGFLVRTPVSVTYVINAEDQNGYVPNTGVKYYESLVEKRLAYDTKSKSYIEINLTNFEAKGQGWTANNVELKQLVKDDRLFGITEVAEIENEINIDRGGYNVFEHHYILGEVNNLTDLTTYRNNYFNLS